MRGSHHLIVQSAHLKYELDIVRNITIIQGDSATGKTTLVEMIQEYMLNGADTGITLSCDVPCRLIEGNTWREQLSLIHGSIVFIDEGNRFVASIDFADAIKNTDNYYVIVTRENLHALPYSVTEIYGMHSSGKFNSLEPVYHSLYRIYDDLLDQAEAIDTVIVEDSSSGYEFFKAAIGNRANCFSANGKSNILGLLENADRSKNILVIADGAAFGSQMNKVNDFARRNGNVILYLPESFEWLLLSANLLSDHEIDVILENPENFIESRKYFSWERYFTQLLIQKTEGTYLKYNKSKLNNNYLNEKISSKVIEVLPAVLKDLGMLK